MDEMNNNTGIESGIDGASAGAAAEGAKTYTQEEVLALIQSESDKRVTAALKTQQKKYEKQLSLSKLDGDERVKAEKDNRIAELEQLVAEMNMERNKSELKSVLSTRGLSAEFADIIAITDDIEASQAYIDRLDKLFKAAVKAEVEKRLAGNAPKGNGASAAEITKEDAKRMTMAQLTALEKSNPELFNKLFN
jgi:DNA primase